MHVDRVGRARGGLAGGGVQGGQELGGEDGGDGHGGVGHAVREEGRREGGRGGGTVRWFANEVGFIGLEGNGRREGGGNVKKEGEQGEQTYTYLISNS